MRLLIYIFFNLLFLYQIVAQQQNAYNCKLEKISLFNERGEKRCIKQSISNTDLFVVIFFNDECPICRYYVPKVNEIDSICMVNKLPLFCVFSGSFKQESIIEFKNLYGIKSDLYLDKKNKLSKNLHATITPEIFLLDTKQRTIVYRGMIDDNFVDLGIRKNNVENNYFLDALNNYLNGKDVMIIQTKPIGCSIDY